MTRFRQFLDGARRVAGRGLERREHAVPWRSRRELVAERELPQDRFLESRAGLVGFVVGLNEAASLRRFCSCHPRRISDATAFTFLLSVAPCPIAAGKSGACGRARNREKTCSNAEINSTGAAALECGQCADPRGAI